MATAAVHVSSTFSQDDINALVGLQARFAATTEATKATRRERLKIIIEGFYLFQSHEGYSSEAAQAIYVSQQISAKLSDAQKAAVAITGENPAEETDPTEKNRMYGRIRTVAGILLQLETDLDAGVVKEDTSADQVIALIEQQGGWRRYGELGNAEQEELEHVTSGSGQSGKHADGDNGGASPGGSVPTSAGPSEHGRDASSDDPEQLDTGEKSAGKTEPAKAADADPVVFDLAECRRLIEQTGITATPTKPIVAPVPRVAFICGADDVDLSLMPLADLPIRLLKELQSFRPHPDEHTPERIRAWGHITTALQLFDRVDSSAPIDLDVEAYPGQDMKPSLPGIILDDPKHLSISASRQVVGMVVAVELAYPLATNKLGLGLASKWVHGTGTKSLIRNLSNAEHRAAYLDPELYRSADDSLKIRFRVRGTTGTDRKDFKIALNPVRAMPGDYWLLRLKPDLQIATSATFDGDLGAQTELLKFAAGAGAAKSLNKAVKLATTRSKELTLKLGASKTNVIGGCALEGDPAVCEVRATDFARAFAFGQEVGANRCRLSIDANGLLVIEFAVDGIGQFKVGIPALREGVRERTLLERVSN